MLQGSETETFLRNIDWGHQEEPALYPGCISNSQFLLRSRVYPQGGYNIIEYGDRCNCSGVFDYAWLTNEI